jgi:hypothetical protein
VGYESQAEVEKVDYDFEPLVDDGRDDLPRCVAGNELPDMAGCDAQLSGGLKCGLAGEDTRSDGGALDGLGMARSGL